MNSPKTIATINFKGGVGKTTVTWCLGDAISSFSDSKVLLFDLDAQMSLTQAISLNEDGYSLEARFQRWYENSIERKKPFSMPLINLQDQHGTLIFPLGSILFIN